MASTRLTLLALLIVFVSPLPMAAAKSLAKELRLLETHLISNGYDFPHE